MILSQDFLTAEALRMESTVRPANLCLRSSYVFAYLVLPFASSSIGFEKGWELALTIPSCMTVYQGKWIQSRFSSLSKMPSHPMTMKSWWSLSILKATTSGSAITTLGFPSSLGSLASISPNVRHTESLPGKTRCGPKTTWLPKPPYACCIWTMDAF